MIPYVKGKVARQAHVGVPEGTCEEEYARGGFFGRYAHLYRRNAPVGWTRIEGPLKPRAYDVARAAAPTKDYLEARIPYLANADCVLSFAKGFEATPYAYRNADCDEVLFVHAGDGRLETDFGPLAYRKGDYLVIPRGTAYRLLPASETSLLVIEATDEVRFPEKGMLGQHALIDPAVIEVPEPEAAPAAKSAPRGEYELRIKREGEITKVFYPFDPLETVGWKGTLTVWRLNVADIRPVVSERYHLPPSAHTTFVTDGFVICTFLPRMLETGDPEAMKVPFYHSNIDFDEVLFYHDGDFFSREGIASGMITFHPQGIHHGPQGQAVERSRAAERTNEIAVMVDTKRPLRPTPAAADCELVNYWQSWKGKP